jgi:NADPH-dependent 2,4-dienoyl-CoA reductase/sulfur reductase-like enzyme
MTVAIIGSGKMGLGFARLLASKRVDVAIGTLTRMPAGRFWLFRSIACGPRPGELSPPQP